MTTQNLLIELLVEELPPKALQKLGESFSSALVTSLQTQGLVKTPTEISSFASPRRLAVHIKTVESKAPSQELVDKLMPVSIGINPQGGPTEALKKRLAKNGLAALADLWPNAVSGSDSIYIENDGKSEALFLRRLAPGIDLSIGLQHALDSAIETLPIPKVMGYQLQDGWTTVNFVRPAHKLVALHGKTVVPVSVLGLQAGNQTQGHRFEAAQPIITLRDADSYAEQLKTEGAVIASFTERRAEIVRQLQLAATKAGDHLQPIADDDLLDEVTALVERPNVLIGQFEAAFLEVPQECLILTMKANQKYFPLLDHTGQLTNKFLIVSNISPTDTSAVIGGNERVVRPRLADAKFFFDQDRKKPLKERVLGLNKVVYHNKLGTQGERTARVADIAKIIGKEIGGDVALAESAHLAATLAKADLLTDMVGEFPELQGIMGRYYALHDGLDQEIANAIEDHYKPRFAGDVLPRSLVGVCVALADKLETLVGLFKIGQLPTGDKDPFALRRHALGIVRILIEKKLPLNLDTLLTQAYGTFASSDSSQTDPLSARNKTIQQVLEFVFERLAGQLKEQGYSAQEIDAVLVLQPQRLSDIPARLLAVRAFSNLPEATSLAAANKRVGNILKKVAGSIPASVQSEHLQETAEQALHGALCSIQPIADSLFHNHEYAASLRELAALKEPVDVFFEKVMVNTDNSDLRNNRLALLQQLHTTMNRVADLSRLSS